LNLEIYSRAVWMGGEDEGGRRSRYVMAEPRKGKAWSFGEEMNGRKLKSNLEGLDKASSIVCHAAKGAG
jgi:hypothetical protein